MYSPITTDFPKTECWNTRGKIDWKTISLHLIVTFYFFFKITCKLVGKKNTFKYIQTYWNPIMYCTSRAPSYNSAIICCRKEKFCISPVEGKNFGIFWIIITVILHYFDWLSSYSGSVALWDYSVMLTL